MDRIKYMIVTMLPKIVVGKKIDQEKVRHFFGFGVENEISLEGNETNVKDLRGWINFAKNIVEQDANFRLVIWNADELSKECQAVLLKPLEEKNSKSEYYLVVKNDNGILPTILSRCEVVNLDKSESFFESSWLEIVKCWKGGPAKCVIYTDKKMEPEVIKGIFLDVAERLRLEVRKKINGKRLKILSLALASLKDLSNSKVNPRLCLEDFLLQSWMVTRQ